MFNLDTWLLSNLPFCWPQPYGNVNTLAKWPALDSGQTTKYHIPTNLLVSIPRNWVFILLLDIPKLVFLIYFWLFNLPKVWVGKAFLLSFVVVNCFLSVGFPRTDTRTLSKETLNQWDIWVLKGVPQHCPVCVIYMLHRKSFFVVVVDRISNSNWLLMDSVNMFQHSLVFHVIPKGHS